MGWVAKNLQHILSCPHHFACTGPWQPIRELSQETLRGKNSEQLEGNVPWIALGTNCGCCYLSTLCLEAGFLSHNMHWVWERFYALSLGNIVYSLHMWKVQCTCKYKGSEMVCRKTIRIAAQYLERGFSFWPCLFLSCNPVGCLWELNRRVKSKHVRHSA